MSGNNMRNGYNRSHSSNKAGSKAYKNQQPRELRRSTGKEELVALTGDFIDAVILNHLIKCQARAQHLDQYIEEERARRAQGGHTLDLQDMGGWFYKKAKQLSEETMLNFADSTMLARIKKLVNRGWVLERTNPYHQWDETMQYRVLVRKIDDELRLLGYRLDGWLISQITPDDEGEGEDDNSDDDEPDPTMAEEYDENSVDGIAFQPTSEGASMRTEDRDSDSEIRDSISEIRSSESQKRPSKSKNQASVSEDRNPQNRRAIPSTGTTSSTYTSTYPPSKSTTTAPAALSDDAVENAAHSGASRKNDTLNQSDLEPSEPVLIEALRKAKISRNDAERLATEFPGECQWQLAALSFHGKLRNPAGFLITAIEKSWDMPAEWEEFVNKENARWEKRHAHVRQSRAQAQAQQRKQEEATRQAQEAAALDEAFARLSKREREAILSQVRERCQFIGDESHPAFQAERRLVQRQHAAHTDEDTADRDSRRAKGGGQDQGAEYFARNINVDPGGDGAAPEPRVLSPEEAADLRRRTLLSNDKELDAFYQTLNGKEAPRIKRATEEKLKQLGVSGVGETSNAWISCRRSAMRDMIQSGTLTVA